MSDLPKRVLIAEEGPREGFQSEKKMIPVADKVRLIEALADTGLGRIACVSYVNPKRVPTMADAEEVAAGDPAQARHRVQRPVAQPAGPRARPARAAACRRRRARHRLGHLLAQEHRQVGARRHGRAAHVAQDLQGPRHAGRMGHHPGRLRLQLRGRALDRADPAARAAGARRGRAGGLQAQGHQAHRRHGLGDAAVGRAPDRRHPHQVARARDRRCTCTTRAAPAWPAPMPACGSASPSSTPRSPAWAAARSPRPTARPATSAPRTSPSCARRWASRPASTSTA